MGDPETLSWFINFVVEKYQAETYALILWDHGGNWEEVCWDWTNDDYLTIQDVQGALGQVSGVEISLLGFDACLMTSIEVGYELSLNKLNVMVELKILFHGMDTHMTRYLQTLQKIRHGMKTYLQFT